MQYAAAFAAGTADLPVAETARLETFLDQSGVRPNDRVFVAAPVNDPLAAERVRRVVTLLAQRGLGAEPIALPQAELVPNHVVVLSDRYIAVPPACPDWSASASHDNAASSNYGCATMSDLSLMIDNPRDLMRGQELGPALGESGRRFRDALSHRNGEGAVGAARCRRRHRSLRRLHRRRLRRRRRIRHRRYRPRPRRRCSTAPARPRRRRRSKSSGVQGRGAAFAHAAGAASCNSVPACAPLPSFVSV